MGKSVDDIKIKTKEAPKISISPIWVGTCILTHQPQGANANADRCRTPGIHPHRRTGVRPYLSHAWVLST
jgi:hypothetical protein